MCQNAGTRVGTTSVWNKLADGDYVTDYYVNTQSKTACSAPLPRCSYPFQVTTAMQNQRSALAPATPSPARFRAVRSVG